MKDFEEGFWISYIDVLTLLLSIFLILYMFTSNKLRNYELVDQRIAEFTKSWKVFKGEMEKIGARPYIDKESGGWKLEIVEDILFKVDSYELSEDSVNKLKKVSRLLKKFLNSNDKIKNSVRIVVGGHANRTGPKDYNILLTTKRARSVGSILRSELKGLGIPIEEVGYGYKYLRKDLSNPKDRRHRRVTITIQPIAVKYLEENNISRPFHSPLQRSKKNG